MKSSKYHLLTLILTVGIVKTDVVGDFPFCTKYNNPGLDFGGSKPVSYRLESLRSNQADVGEYFNGRFYVNPEAFGPTWISFKPVGEYAQGEEYRVVVFSDRVYVGVIGKSDCGTFLPNNMTNWFPVDIVLKQSGLVQVSLNDDEEPLECSLPGMSDNPPKFLEMKGIDSEQKEISVFYDCWIAEGDENNEVEKI
ncbi:hypothetical protein ACFFRR_011436 [Megaselia abdita]